MANPIYLNGSITTGIFSSAEQNNSSQPSKFIIAMDDILLQNPQEYYVTLNRVKLHTENIPIYIFPIVPDQPNANLSPFIISFEYQTAFGVSLVRYSNNVIFQSQYLGFVPPSVGIRGQNLQNEIILEYYSLYDISQMLKIFNDSIETIWIDFVNLCIAAGIVLPNQDTPYYIYNNSTKLFSLVLNKANFDQSPAIAQPTIYMFQDQLSANLFNAPFYIVDKAIRINPSASCKMSCYELYNNNGIANCFTMTASSSSLNIWCPATRIVFLSDMPTQLEYDISSTNETFVSTNGANAIDKPQIPVFFDLLINADDFVSNPNIVQYSVSSIAQSRLVSFKSSPAIKNINIEIYWIDAFNNKHKLTTNGNTNNLIKLAFYKKSTCLL